MPAGFWRCRGYRHCVMRTVPSLWSCWISAGERSRLRDSSGVVGPCYDVWVVVDFWCGEILVWGELP